MQALGASGACHMGALFLKLNYGPWQAAGADRRVYIPVESWSEPCPSPSSRETRFPTEECYRLQTRGLTQTRFPLSNYQPTIPISLPTYLSQSLPSLTYLLRPVPSTSSHSTMQSPPFPPTPSSSSNPPPTTPPAVTPAPRYVITYLQARGPPKPRIFSEPLAPALAAIPNPKAQAFHASRSSKAEERSKC